MKSDFTKYWLSLLPLILLVTMGLIFVVPLIPHSTASPEAVQHLFLGFNISEVRPEPLEHLRYIFAVIALPLLYWMLIRLQKILSAEVLAVLIIQFALIVFLGFNFFQVEFHALHLAEFIILFLLAGFGIIYFRKPIGDWLAGHPKTIAILSVFSCVAYAAIRLMPSIMLNAGHVAQDVSYHYQYTLAEFEAVINGKTLLVDFFPQYQNLLPSLVAPLLSLTGNAYIGCALLFLFLSGFILWVAWYVFYRQSRSYLATALLFIPFVATSFFPIYSDKNGYLYNAFNYYAIGPLRYLGPFSVLLLLTLYLSNPTTFRRYGLFIVAGFFALNSPDFGISAMLGAAAAVLLFHSPTLIPRWKDIKQILIPFITGLAVAVIILILVTLISSGKFPKLGKILLYQTIFVKYGFFMLPMPMFGMQWLLFTGYMASLFYALIRLAGDSFFSARKNSSALLVYTATVGLGTLMYFMGRSHPILLILLFTIGSFNGLLLGYTLYSDWQERSVKLISSIPDVVVRILPYGACLFLYLLMWSNILQTPNPVKEYQRIIRPDPAFTEWENKLSTFIASKTRPQEKVMIIGPYGWKLSNKLQLDNVYPYAAGRSLITKPQLARVINNCKQLKIKHVFMAVPVEIKQTFTSQGYHCDVSLPFRSKAQMKYDLEHGIYNYRNETYTFCEKL